MELYIAIDLLGYYFPYETKGDGGLADLCPLGLGAGVRPLLRASAPSSGDGGGGGACMARAIVPR